MIIFFIKLPFLMIIPTKLKKSRKLRKKGLNLKEKADKAIKKSRKEKTISRKRKK